MTMMSIQLAETPGDRAGDRRVLMLVSGLLLAAFAIGAAVQTVYVFHANREPGGDPVSLTMEAALRIAINLLCVVVVVGLIWIVRLNERAVPERALRIGIIAVSAAVLRFSAQLITGIYPQPTYEIALSELSSVILVATVAVILGLVVTDARSRLRMQERESAGQALRAAEALEALASEELRVRREVAENLHGTVQNRLLMVRVEMDGLVARVRAGNAVDAADLTRLRDAIDDIRERDVREMSHLLYPVGVNVGAGHAIRLLAQRIPATIATDVAIDPRLAVGDDLNMDQRVLLVRAAEEAITNALKHGNAGALQIVLADGDSQVLLTVDNDGEPFAPEGPMGSGLKRLSDRAEGLGGELIIDGMEEAGTRLRVVLPV